MSEQNKTDAVQSIAELQEALAKRDARIEDLEREIERLKESHRLHAARLITERGLLRDELAALKARQSGGVVPEQDGSHAQISFWAGFEAAVCGLHGVNIRAAWNEFKSSEQFARLNSSPVSAGPVVGYQFHSKEIGGNWEVCNLAAYLYRRGNSMFETRYTQLTNVSAGGVDERAAEIANRLQVLIEEMGEDGYHGSEICIAAHDYLRNHGAALNDGGE